MDSHSLVNDEIKAGAELVEKFDKSFPVKAAFWLKPQEVEGWYFYVVCDQLGTADTRRVAGEFTRLVREMQNPLLTTSQVKLVRSSDWVARSVAEIQQRRTVPGGLWFHGDSLGGIEIDGAYFYPSLVTQAL